jgi:aminoglycoside 6-adenylyltransferase
MDNGTIFKLISFGEANENIRAIILEGSHATGNFIDALSDYDVNIFTINAEPFLKNANWLSQFGEVLIYQKEELNFYGQTFPSRLVVFRDGNRIDFSYWPVSALVELAGSSKRYESYRNGFRVLVDKDGLTMNLPEPDGLGFQVTPPDRDQFLQTIYDFWFEAYCIARGLARGDLWYAKRIEDSYIKDHLYQMLLWEHQSRKGWVHDPLLHQGGKRFEQWAETELLKEISSCFSNYSNEATWESLFAMFELFNGFAKRVAANLGVEVPEKKSRDVKDYLESLKSLSK